MQMPGFFEPVHIGWQGRNVVIQPDTIMPLLAKIEDVITLADLYRFSSTGRVPVAKLATAYAIILRHGGINVTDQEVYVRMFEGSTQKNVRDAVQMLLMLMVPPSSIKMDEKQGKGSPRRKTAGASKRPSRQQS